MSYLAFYRKYRPKTFDEIYGQNFIVKTLKNIIKNNQVSHSYLFIGPRGTGKTSTAKIFAKTINCKNNHEGISCEKCLNCISSNNNENIDIIEMDAASNNGVDEIREIVNHVTLMPNNSKYKIYIIDEVHMLSAGAFNALLKTLEEPPKHAIFILATTDPQKVPLTIKSRCQNFEFKYINKKSISDRLKIICKLEKIEIDDESLNLIADISKGGLRDAISLLDQLNSYTNGKISKKDIIKLNGNITEENIKNLLNYIINEDYENTFKYIDELELKGKNLSIVCEDIIKYLKNNFIKKNLEFDNNQIIKLIINFNDCLNSMKLTSDKRICFDLCLLKCFNSIIKQTNVCNSENSIEISKIHNNEIKQQENRKTQNIENYKNLMNIRLNNILLEADKESLNEYDKKIKNISNDISDLENYKLTNLLIESEVKAGSKNGLVITVSNENILEELYVNLFKIESLLKNIVKRKLEVCFLLDSEWIKKRPIYISKIKNKELKYENETGIIQSIKSSNLEEKNEFESLLEIGEK